jgi:hypothetical protein
MDVLPHLEAVAFQKVSAFGRVATIVVPVSELKYVKNPEPSITYIIQMIQSFGT